MHRPLAQDLVSQFFGETSPLYTHWGLLGHNGIDLPVPVGTPVYAAHSGIVHKLIIEDAVSSSGTRGLGIILRQKNPSGGKFYATAYWHLSEFKVKEGYEIKEGDLIALSGNTGFSTGPHLHFGLKYYDLKFNTINDANGYGGYIDPYPYIMKINADELRSLYNLIFGRDPDDAAWGYVDQDLSLVLNEFSKSPEFQADSAVLRAVRSKFSVIV